MINDRAGKVPGRILYLSTHKLYQRSLLRGVSTGIEKNIVDSEFVLLLARCIDMAAAASARSRLMLRLKADSTPKRTQK